MKIRGFEFISEEQQKKDFGRVISDLRLPERATKGSAGYDFYAPFDIKLDAGESISVPTGIRSYMQKGEVLKVYPRSGLGFKHFARLANTVGIIDEDYYFSDNEGHIFIKLRNEKMKDSLFIKKGEAFAQGIFSLFLLSDSDDLSKGKIRNGGFGSSNK